MNKSPVSAADRPAASQPTGSQQAGLESALPVDQSLGPDTGIDENSSSEKLVGWGTEQVS